ncbi:MAG: S24 family peptidase [Bacteroidota bacterium]
MPVSRQTIYDWFKADTPLQSAIGAVVSTYPTVDPVWLSTGNGEMLRADVPADSSPTDRRPDGGEVGNGVAISATENGGLVPPGYTRVPEILIEPSASDAWDSGTIEEVAVEEQPSDTIFPDWYIRSEYGVSPERIRFVRVRGDSMVPTIAPGQRLVVALLAPGTTLRDGAIYILVGPGGAQVKRLIMEPDHIHVWSDNPDRPRFKVALATFSKDYTVVAVVLEANLKL